VVSEAVVRSGEGVAEAVTEPRERPAEAAQEDEESVDEYMARLMARLKTMTDTEVPDDRDVRSSEPSAMSRQAFLGANHPYRQNHEGEEESGEEATGESQPARPTVRRSRSALESVSSLAALRELATAAAASAITTHTRNRLRKMIRGKLFLSSVALALGVGLIVSWSAWGLQTRSLYIGAAGIFLSLLWVVQWAVLSGRLIRTRSGHLSWNPQHLQRTEEERTTSSVLDAETASSLEGGEVPGGPGDAPTP
jgi:hypothetical protein